LLLLLLRVLTVDSASLTTPRAADLSSPVLRRAALRLSTSGVNQRKPKGWLKDRDGLLI
jgi:hypothetical protein